VFGAHEWDLSRPGKNLKRKRQPVVFVAFVTRYSQNKVMKTAKVAELKAKLSAYLAEVRRGGSVIVYDRNTPIARLIPFQEEQDDLVIVDASAPVSALKAIKGVRPRRRIDVDRILRESRGDR
jgi:prevent-host-death family protein